MMEDRWFSVDEIAAYLGIKRDTVLQVDRRKANASASDGPPLEIAQGRSRRMGEIRRSRRDRGSMT